MDSFTHDLIDNSIPKRDSFIARIDVLERHADGANRKFTLTRSVPGNMTIAELFEWRELKIHDPVNGEVASREIKITPDEAFSDF